MEASLPVLYSFRRCPYAIRARLALVCAQQIVELREVVLKDKPTEMIGISSKGTVPVLQLVDGTVIDESRDIMLWALQQNDPARLLPAFNSQYDSDRLLEENDSNFKHWLDRYKYADRYPDHSPVYYRDNAELFLKKLESRLLISQHLFGPKPTLSDIAIIPFIRQFTLVDKPWFDQSPYVNLQRWLAGWMNSALFESVMKKYPQWRAESRPDPIIFPSRRYDIQAL